MENFTLGRHESRTVLIKSAFGSSESVLVNVKDGPRAVVSLDIESLDGGASVEVKIEDAFDTDAGFEEVSTFSRNAAGRTDEIVSDYHSQLKITATVTGGNATFRIGITLSEFGGPELIDGSVPVKETGPNRTVFVFGANPEHVTGIRQVIWDSSSNYTFLSAAENLDVYSDNANDTVAGVGARTVRISGLDASYNEIEEVVNLNGTTPVTTTQQFLRRNRIAIDSAGTSGTNLGNITIEGSSVQGYIAQGIGRDRSVIYTVPAGYTGRLKQIFASVGPSVNAAGVKYGDLDIVVTEFGKPARVTNIGYIMSNGTQAIDTTFGSPRDFPEKTDMALAFTTEKEGAATSGFLEIYLEPV